MSSTESRSVQDPGGGVPAALTRTWLVLVLLTLISLGFGRWFHGAAWLPVLVAAILGFKGWLVARRFIEVRLAHGFIRFVLYAFVAAAPVALVLTAFHGAQFAQWTLRWVGH